MAYGRRQMCWHVFGRGFDSHRFHIYFMNFLKTSQNVDILNVFIFILSIISYNFLQKGGTEIIFLKITYKSFILVLNNKIRESFFLYYPLTLTMSTGTMKLVRREKGV